MENKSNYFKRNWFYIVCCIFMVFCVTVLFNGKTHSFFKETHIGTLVAKDKALVREGKYSEETAYMFAFELDNNTSITQRYSLYEYAKYNVGDKFNIELSVNQGWIFLAIVGITFSWLAMMFYSFSRSDH